MELANCELILEHLPGAMVIDMQGTIIYINKQCADYIGTDCSHALGSDVREIFPDTKMIDSLKLGPRFCMNWRIIIPTTWIRN